MKFPAIAAIALAALSSGCGTRRIVEHPYEDVVAAARERFVRIYPGGYFALRAEITEAAGQPRLKVVFHEFIDYSRVMETELRIDGMEDGRTRLEATVLEFYRSWYFRRRREDLEATLLEVFDERLRTGVWPPLPWMKPAGTAVGGATATGKPPP